MNLVYGRLSQSESLEIARQIELSGTKFHLAYNGFQVVRSGQDVYLVMINAHTYINELIAAITAEHLHYPVIACGIETDSAAAVAAIKFGAKEYLPIPPDADLIAAVYEAISEDQDALVCADPVMKKWADMVEKVASHSG